MCIHNIASLGNSQIIQHLLFLNTVPGGTLKEAEGGKKA